MMLVAFLTTDKKILAVDSMQAFLIDLLAPGAQPPVDKQNGCQDQQLEGTCVTVLKCRNRWRCVFRNECLWAHSLCATSHHRHHLAGISLFASLATAIFTVFFSVVLSWLSIACQIHSGVELSSPFLRLRFLAEWDSSERKNSYVCILLSSDFSRKPKGVSVHHLQNPRYKAFNAQWIF